MNTDDFIHVLVQPYSDPTTVSYLPFDKKSYVVIADRADKDMINGRTMANASDDPRFTVVNMTDVIDASVDRDPLRIAEVASSHGVDIDDITTKYAERLQDVYDSQTAGSYTFHGVLAMFLMELEGR